VSNTTNNFIIKSNKIKCLRLEKYKYQSEKRESPRGAYFASYTMR